MQNTRPTSSFYKASFLYIILLAGMFNTGFGQTGEALKKMAPEQRATLYTDTMRTILQLNDTQYPQVLAINKATSIKIDAALKTTESSKLSKFKKVKAIDQERDAQLKPVLTKEQYELYLDKKKEIIEQMKEKYKERN